MTNKNMNDKASELHAKASPPRQASGECLPSPRPPWLKDRKEPVKSMDMAEYPDRRRDTEKKREPAYESSPFPLDKMDRIVKNLGAVQKNKVKTFGTILLPQSSKRRVSAVRTAHSIVVNPWKAAVQVSVGPVSTPEAKTAETHRAEPSEGLKQEIVREESALDEVQDEEQEIKIYSKPMTIMEVFMATKKRKKGVRKKKSAISAAMEDALAKQEEGAKTIEKMVASNINAETYRKSAQKAKKSLGKIVSEKVSKGPEKKVAAKAPKVEGAKPRRKVTRPKKASEPVEVLVESLGSGVVHTLGDAVGGVVNAGQAAGSAVFSGAKKATGKVKTLATSFEGEGAVAAATKTAADVTTKVADGMVSAVSGAAKVSSHIVSGAAIVAGYTVKGGVGLVCDTVEGVFTLILGHKKKKRKSPGSKSGKKSATL